MRLSYFFGCPHCNTVAQPDIPSGSAYRTIPEGQQHPEGRVPFGALLECAQKGCASHIEELGISTAIGINNLQERKPWRTWNFGREVQCENMHPPTNPVEIASLKLDSCFAACSGFYTMHAVFGSSHGNIFQEPAKGPPDACNMELRQHRFVSWNARGGFVAIPSLGCRKRRGQTAEL